MWPKDIEDAAHAIVVEFAGKKLLIATAESCTAGLIAGAITEIAGSSVVFDRGFVTYSNEAKREMIGVANATLKAHGAVSRPTALEMAQGAIGNSGANISIAVTGIAGPGGGTEEKPVGLVHLAAARTGYETLHREMRYGDIGRSAVRLATVRTALEMLIEISQN
ncbi:nicotinamide-nucleotide amidohydrolase family protein [Shinella kummerowiae]|uniref:Nicotinamide-nucleotide amidohydrolase family protein n=1 Tax=Shinella kummerowiae TaxID=417745 RepID=A0A6N8S9Y3_9HYPH|nr:nicotinamide-nucleotide amidohydrolase family protein [Shinella kummerowiae]